MQKLTYLRDKLKQILGLGFAAGDQGVLETVEANRQTLVGIRGSLGLPPDSPPSKVLEAVKELKARCAEIKARGG